MNPKKRREVVVAAKRVVEAIGYTELGMTKQARACLQRLGRRGAFAPVIKRLLREIARRESALHEDAIPVELAERLGPDPVDREIWLLLGACCHKDGQSERVSEALRYARHAPPAQAER